MSTNPKYPTDPKDLKGDPKDPINPKDLTGEPKDPIDHAITRRLDAKPSEKSSTGTDPMMTSDIPKTHNQ